MARSLLMSRITLGGNYALLINEPTRRGSQSATVQGMPRGSSCRRIVPRRQKQGFVHCLLAMNGPSRISEILKPNRINYRFGPSSLVVCGNLRHLDSGQLCIPFSSNLYHGLPCFAVEVKNCRPGSSTTIRFRPSSSDSL